MKTKLKHYAVSIRRFLMQVAFILLITIVLGEVGLRAYNMAYPTFVFYDDSYNRFRGKPHSYNFGFRLNSKGFKDEEILEKRTGVYRILGIGDSFAFGIVPYDQSYLTLLERKFQEQSFDAEVINFGIPSIGPKDYLSLLLDEGLDLEPDMLLLSFFTGNDFGESEPRKLQSYSYVASLLQYFLSLFQNYEGQLILAGAEYCDDCPTLNEDEHLKVEFIRSFVYDKSSPRFSAYFERAMVHLRKISDICREKNIDLLVVVIPDEIQINAKLEANVLSKFYPEITADKWDITQPNERLAAELDRLGINNIDLYKYFKENPTAQYYKPRDSHWNVAGNELAAVTITNYIQNMRATIGDKEAIR